MPNSMSSALLTVVDYHARKASVAHGATSVVDAAALAPLRNGDGGTNRRRKCNRRKRVLHDDERVSFCLTKMLHFKERERFVYDIVGS